jgi:predicted dehydrogenase
MKNAENRRSFLKKLGIGSLAIPILSATNGLPNNKFEGKKLGIAIVGLGNYATNQIGVGLENSEFWNVTGIVTGTPTKIPAWKKKWGIEDKNIFDYKNFDKIKDAKDIDVVYICLPNSMHAEYTIKAAKAGKHVICEKPMATSVADAKAMIQACNKANVKLAIGYRCHFEPFNLEVMKYAKEETFGHINFIQSSFGFAIGDPKQWRLNGKMSGGGPLMDVGIYCVNAARYITRQEPVSVIAHFGPVTDVERFKEVEESITWHIEFPDKTLFNGVSTYKNNIEKLYASGPKGFFELSPAFSYGPLKGNTNLGKMDLPIVQHQQYQMNGMAPLFMSNDPMPDHCSGQEGLKDMKVLMAIYESAKNNGRKIML